MNVKFSRILMLFTLICLLASYGCKKDPIEEPMFTLSVNSVEIITEKTTKVEITGGSTYSVSSNNNDIATASIQGKTITITAKKHTGTADIKVIDANDSSRIAEIKVTVKEDPMFTLSATSAEITLDNSFDVEITGKSTYSVSSSDSDIATASITEQTIIIKAKEKAGTATIKVTDTKDASLTAEIQVKVIPNPMFTLSVDSAEILAGNSLTVEVTGESSYSVSSANEDIAMASIKDKTITITTKESIGTTTIKVTDTKTPSQTMDITINVIENIPEGVVIQDGVLISWDCSKLPKNGHIDIPKSVTKIGNKVFKSCVDLISVSMGDNVTSIGDEAFALCGSLNNVKLSSNITHIGAKAFNGCLRIPEINLPAKLISIGDFAFEFCESLTAITLPNTLTEIGERAFASAPFSTIIIPSSVNKIGDGVFSNCANLTSIDVDNASNSFVSVNGVLFNKDKTKLIQYPKGKSGYNYAIPASVTSIGKEAFYYCQNLSEITIPEGVTRIEDRTFVGTFISSVKIPEAVTYIGEHAFSQTQLTSLTLPANVEKIGKSAFANNSNLEDLVLNDKLTEIPDFAFHDCEGLTTLKMGKNITRIGKSAFYHCNYVEELVLSESLTFIDELAFSDCHFSKRIHIPASVKTIKERAFAEVWDATDIICDAVNPPLLGADVFVNIAEGRDVKLHVPKGSKAAYSTADQWKNFIIVEE